MGCIYACTCGGFCPGCQMYEKEQYFGHAEDLAAQAKGYRNYDDMLVEQDQKQQQEQDSPQE